MPTADIDGLKTTIEAAFEQRATIDTSRKGPVRDAVEAALNLLDKGAVRVAEKIDGKWVVHEWLKKAVLLYFRLSPNHLIAGAPGEGFWYDKMDSKFAGWGEAE